MPKVCINGDGRPVWAAGMLFCEPCDIIEDAKIADAEAATEHAILHPAIEDFDGVLPGDEFDAAIDRAMEMGCPICGESNPDPETHWDNDDEHRAYAEAEDAEVEYNLADNRAYAAEMGR